MRDKQVSETKEPQGQISGLQSCDTQSANSEAPFAAGFRAGYQRKTAETKDWVEDAFTYHPPSSEQLLKYQAIREAAKYFARVLLANTPCGADQSAAMRKLREAVMTANAAIAIMGNEL